MKTSEGNKNIIKALAKAQSEFNTVGKDRENPFASSRYATLDAILKEILPKLNDNNLFLTQEPLTDHDENTVRIGVHTKIFHDSGEWIEYEPLFMILEKGAKMNMAQSAGSIITYAKRYAISAIFGISTDDDNDGVQPKYDNIANNQRNNNNQPYRKQHEQKTTPTQNVSDINQKLVEASDRIKELGGDIEIVKNQFLESKGMTSFKQAYKKKELFEFMNEVVADMKEHAEQGELMNSGTTTAKVNWGQ